MKDTSARENFISGLQLFPLHAGAYRLGTRARYLDVRDPIERTVISNIALGLACTTNIPDGNIANALAFCESLLQRGFLVSPSALEIPKRYLDQPTERDAAVLQLRERAASELHAASWIDGNLDGGVKTVSTRKKYVIELSGRSRTITLLHSILLASGCADVRFRDSEDSPIIRYAEIGAGSIRAGDVGSNYYSTLHSQKRGLALFPSDRKKGRSEEVPTPMPTLVIHDGPVTPYLLSDWMSTSTPHLLIQAPIGDTITIGPLILPGKTPCLRCFQLHEIDQNGYSTSQALSITGAAAELDVDSIVPQSMAHSIAGFVSILALNYLDQIDDSIQRGRELMIGKVTELSFSLKNKPQEAGFDFHPHCGCRE